MLFYLCLLLYISSVQSRVDMLQVDFEYLNNHPIPQTLRHNVSAELLQDIIQDEWLKIVEVCPALDPTANIKAEFDDDLIGTNTLAWASQTLLLKDLSYWVPSISTADFFGHDFLIGVNPQPPNGWYTYENCANILYRYDLRTVLRHEMLHGVGIGSSIKKDGSWSMGHFWNGICLPRYYDTQIEDMFGNNIVSGCTVQDITGKSVYINGVKLYNPYTYQQGSSLSHHTIQGKLMYYQISPMDCINLDTEEFKLLSGLGLDCHGTESNAPPVFHVWIILLPIILMLYLF